MCACFYNYKKNTHTFFQLPSERGEALALIASLVNETAILEDDGTVVGKLDGDPKFLAKDPLID